MTKTEEKMLETLARICTRLQDEHVGFIYTAHAMWSMLNQNEESVADDIEELLEMLHEKKQGE